MNGALLAMPESAPSPNNLLAMSIDMNMIVPGNINPFLRLSTARSLFLFFECSFHYKTKDAFTWIVCGW